VTDQRGYILMESLIGLLLLAILTSTMLHAMPAMLDAKTQLDQRQVVYNRLFEIRSQHISQGIFHQVCEVFQWRGRYEEICL